MGTAEWFLLLDASATKKGFHAFLQLAHPLETGLASLRCVFLSGKVNKCEDSPLPELLVGSFFLLVESASSGLILFWNSSINVEMVSLRDSRVCYWDCMVVDCSCWNLACLTSYRAISSGVLAIWEPTSFLFEDEVD